MQPAVELLSQKEKDAYHRSVTRCAGARASPARWAERPERQGLGMKSDPGPLLYTRCCAWFSVCADQGRGPGPPAYRCGGRLGLARLDGF